MRVAMSRRATALFAVLVVAASLAGACASGAPPVYALSGAVTVGAYPAVGTVWATVPSGYRVVTVGHRHYYAVDGIFYHRVGGRYVVVGAPVGATVRRLPAGARVVKVRGRRYHTFHGAYYRYDARKRIWLVVAP